MCESRGTIGRESLETMIYESMHEFGERWLDSEWHQC